MKSKRVITLMLAVVMLLTLAACTGAPASEQSQQTANTQNTSGTQSSVVNENGMPIAKEKLTFTLMAPRLPQQADWNELWVFSEIAKRTNLQIKVECVNSESWAEKKNLAFATNTLPDFFFEGLTDFDYVNYGGQGLLISMNKLVDQYAPNIKKSFEQFPAVRKMATAPDGNIYGIPGFIVTKRELSARRFWINKAWIDNLGLSIPKTVDDYYNVLKAFKTEDADKNGDAGDEIPIGGMFAAKSTASTTADGLYNYFAMDIPILTAFGYIHTRIDTIDDKVVFVPTEQNYKEYLRFVNKLYSEKLIDQEYFSQTEEQYTAKGSKGQYGAFCYYADWAMMTDEKLYSQYTSIPPLVSSFSSKQQWPAWDAQPRGGVAITNKCKNPETILRLLDWMYTEEGSTVVQMGVENGKWEGGEGGWELVKNENGQEGYKLVFPGPYKTFNEFRQQKITTMSLPYVSIPDVQPIVERIATLDAKQRKLTADINDNFSPFYKAPFPKTIMTKEENDEINMLATDLYTYVEQMEARFITGEESLDNFDAFVKACKDRGSEKLVEIRQKVYDRWKNN